MNKKVKISVIAAAMLAVAPVVTTVTTGVTPTTVQAKSYSTKDYKNAGFIIPKKNIKISVAGDTQTLKAGVTYDFPDDAKSFDTKSNSYIYTSFNPHTNRNEKAIIKASDVTPFDFYTDKTIKKYVKVYNKAVKKYKKGYLGIKFKKNTTIFIISNKVGDTPLMNEASNFLTAKKRSVKKNKVLTVDHNPESIDAPYINKYKGKYYYTFPDVRVKGKREQIYVPVNSVTFTKVSKSNAYKAKYSL